MTPAYSVVGGQDSDRGVREHPDRPLDRGLHRLVADAPQVHPRPLPLRGRWNPDAARLSGISVARIKTYAYLISGGAPVWLE